jgi:hypothetical protein
LFEVGVILAIAAGAAVLAGWRRNHAGAESAEEDQLVDLPCPWCNAQTNEDDLVCPGCHQAFGVLHS